METEKHEAKKRKRKHKKRKRGGEDPTISVPSTSPPRDPLCHKAPTRNIDHRNGRGVFSSKEEGAATHPPPAGVDLSIVSTFASLGHNEIKLEKIRRYIELKKESAALYAEICQHDDEEIAQADDEIYSYDEFLKIYKVTAIHFSTCGHRNMYQTCFLNVVLHCFAFTRPFLLYLRGDNYGKECCESDTKWCLLCGMRRYIRLVTDQKKSVYPEEIISHLQMFFHGFILGLQQDAYEFMIHARKKMELDFFDKHGGDLHAPKKNIIHHLFGGVLRSQVTCYRCENVSATYDEMQDLAVEIEGSARARSLQDCLDLFTTTEDVDYKCPRCKEVKAKKRLSIYESPNILTIILKRFKDAGKLDQFIYYPMELDITEHTSSTVGDNWYDLYAVVIHEGRSLNCGHYMCYVKDYEGRWLLNDDKKVTIISEDRVRDKDAYMLCYIRRTARPEPPIDIKQTMEQKQDDGRSDPHQRTREMEKKENKTRTLPTNCDGINVKKYLYQELDEVDCPVEISDTDGSDLEGARESFVIAKDINAPELIEQINKKLKFYEQTGHFELPSLGKGSTVYDKDLMQLCMVRKGSYLSRSSIKANRIAAVLKIVRNQLRQNKLIQQRAIYYMHKRLFEFDSSISDDILREVCRLLECTRSSLNVTVSSGGSVIGPVILYINRHIKINCWRCGTAGMNIPHEAHQVDKIVTVRRVKFILIVEKHTILSMLAGLKFHKKYNCIIITGGGQPDIATRALVHKLRYSLSIPVYGFVDANPYGIRILCTYRFGSQIRSFDNYNLTVHDLNWIGLHSHDLIGKTGLSVLEENDYGILLNLLDLDHIRDWRAYLDDMMYFGLKADIEHVLDYDEIEVYLHKRIRENE